MGNLPKLRDSRRKPRLFDHLQSVLANLPQPAWIAGPDALPLEANDRLRAYFGLSVGEPLDESRLIAQEDLQKLIRLRSEWETHSQAHTADLRLRRYDGKYRWHRVVLSPLEVIDGSVTIWLASCTDINDLMEVQGDFQRFVDAAADGFIGVDTDWRIDHLNASAQRYFGMSFDEVRGKTLWEVFPEAHGTIFEEQYLKAVNEWIPVSFETRPPMRDGWVEVRAYPHDKGLAVFFTDITLRHNAEDLLGLTADAVPVLLSFVDSGLCYRFVNKAYAQHYRRSRDEIVGRNIGDLVGKEAFKVIQPHLLRALSGEEVSYERWVPYADAGNRFVRVTYKPRFAPDGKVLGVFVLVVDNTDRRRAEEALERTQGSLSLAMKGSRMGWWSRDLIHDQVQWSKELEDIFGITGPFSGSEDHFLQHVHPLDRSLVRETVRRAVESRSDYAVEFRYLRPDGSEGWMEGRGSAVYGDDGKPLALYGIGIEVSERKRVERRQSFIVSLSDAVRRLTAPHEIAEAACRMLREELDVGGCAYAFVHSDEDHVAIEYDHVKGVPSLVGSYRLSAFGSQRNEQYLKGEMVVSDDLSLDPSTAANYESIYAPMELRSIASVPLFRDGRWVALFFLHHNRPRNWSEDDLQLLQNVVERVWHAVERARAERALREANAELERRVLIRTAELQASNDALMGFTYHVSHDLRTPLRAIVSTSRILQEDYRSQLTDEAYAMLSRQVEAANKLGLLIDDLLRLSRLSRAEVQPENLDLTKMAEELVGEALTMHPHSRVKVQIQEGLHAKGDANLVRLALMNLIENAIKYSPSGGTILLGKDNDAFFVSDQGIGMESQYLDRIFEPFERLHRDEEFKGTGIGLTNVRQAILRHGGRIWVKSRVGEGSTFYFTLG